jgi:tellurite resistance protein TehA-like permease
MPQSNLPDLWQALAILALSILSGAISIGRRIIRGYQSSCLWILTEMLTAILCGYLAYTAYPTLNQFLPSWVTLPVAVSVAAHSGGRIFQELEDTLIGAVDRHVNKSSK